MSGFQNLALCVVTLLLLVGCSEAGNDTAMVEAGSDQNLEQIKTEPITDTATTESKATPLDSNEANTRQPTTRDQTEFQRLYRLIVFGQANLAQVKTALKTEDTGELVNVIHALYSMRWLRGVTGILQAMWEMNTEALPDVDWDKMKQTPVRIAIASTINRIKIFDTTEYRKFIRDHKYDEHEFNRAQVVVALGLNQDPKDVDYLYEMADGDNVYVSQSAITSLAIMNHEKARDSLVKLANKHKDTQRGMLIIEVLEKAYDMVPTDKPPETEKS